MTIWSLISLGVVVDLGDLPLLYKYNWHISTDNYVVTNAYGGSGKILLHRYLLSASPGQVVDHIDGNRLNNSRTNLRLTDRTVNRLNSSSIGQGVRLTRNQKYSAHFTYKGQRLNLGTFPTYEAALAAKQETVKRLTNESFNTSH